MSSQDTLNSALSEEEKAKTLQQEIDRELAKVNSLQHELGSSSQEEADSLRQDIESESGVIASLQQKYEMYMSEAGRLRQQAIEEQQAEREEQMRRAQNGESLTKKAAKELMKEGLL